MKLDLTRLPVLEMVVGFLLLALIITFVGAFMATDGGGEEEIVQASPTPASPTPGGSPTGTFALTLRDNKFDPTQFTATAGASVTFDIINQGKALHNMHISPSGDAFPEALCTGSGDPCSSPSRIKGGETATLEWTAPPSPGVYQFRCDFHPTEMKGTITVQ